MDPIERRVLIDAVLDGQASPEQVAALDREMAADPAARAEYEHLRQLFADLRALPQPHPPEGLVARVAGSLPARVENRAAGDQLSAASRVVAFKTATADDLYTASAKASASSNLYAPPPNTRSESMNDAKKSLYTNRKTWIGAGVALAAVVVVAQFGFQGNPRQADVAGTVVPAERYRASQTAAADVKLGDQSVAQLMQNDAFVKMIKDPQIQAMARDPGFQAAAQTMLQNADLAKQLLANTDAAKFYAANTDAAKALMTHSDAAKSLMANSEAAKSLMANADAAKFLTANADLAKFVTRNADAAKVLTANTDLAKLLMANGDLARVMMANADMAKNFLKNADLAQFFTANSDAARFMTANAAMAKHVVAMNEMSFTRRYSPNAVLERTLLLNNDAARLFLSNSDAARTLLANADAARTLMAHGDMARHLLANTDAARNILANAALENNAAAKQAK